MDLNRKYFAACFFVAALFALALSPTVSAEVRSFEYDSGFGVVVDCSRHGAVYFSYVARIDEGNAKRSSTFHLDDRAGDCQQKTTRSYWRPKGEPKYHRGHLVPANHFDHSEAASASTNVMTNVLPQTASLNTGAYYQTELITDCMRDFAPVRVFGGVIWGNNPEDDYFVKTHGVKTPDAFWKILDQDGKKPIAWIMPNSHDAKKSMLPSYQVSIAKLEQVIGGLPFDVNASSKDGLSSDWPVRKGCRGA